MISLYDSTGNLRPYADIYADATTDIINTKLGEWVSTMEATYKSLYPNENIPSPKYVAWLYETAPSSTGSNPVYVRGYTPYVPTDADVVAYLTTLNYYKISRAQLVAAIVVTTSTGKAFNGDETSQGRMARALAVMTSTDTTSWVLADNTVATVTQAEFIEALKLSGVEQTKIWITGKA